MVNNDFIKRKIIDLSCLSAILVLFMILTVEECDRLLIDPFAYDGGETLYVDETYIVIGVDDVNNFLNSY